MTGRRGGGEETGLSAKNICFFTASLVGNKLFWRVKYKSIGQLEDTDLPSID